MTRIMIHWLTPKRKKPFLSRSAEEFPPMIQKSSVVRLIKSARKRMKTAGERERYALLVIIKEMESLKEKL